MKLELHFGRKNLVSSCKVAHGRGTTNREANTAHRKDEGNGKQIEEGKKLSSIYYVSDSVLASKWKMRQNSCSLFSTGFHIYKTRVIIGTI